MKHWGIIFEGNEYNGGLVYASDFAGWSLVQAFPNHLTMGSAAGGIHNVNVVDAGLAAHMGQDVLSVLLPGGVVIVYCQHFFDNFYSNDFC